MRETLIRMIAEILDRLTVEQLRVVLAFAKKMR